MTAMYFKVSENLRLKRNGRTSQGMFSEKEIF
jgi:hypothetical protein